MRPVFLLCVFSLFGRKTLHTPWPERSAFSCNLYLARPGVTTIKVLENAVNYFANCRDFFWTAHNTIYIYIRMCTVCIHEPRSVFHWFLMIFKLFSVENAALNYALERMSVLRWSTVYTRSHVSSPGNGVYQFPRVSTTSGEAGRRQVSGKNGRNCFRRT